MWNFTTTHVLPTELGHMLHTYQNSGIRLVLNKPGIFFQVSLFSVYG